MKSNNRDCQKLSRKKKNSSISAENSDPRAVLSAELNAIKKKYLPILKNMEKKIQKNIEKIDRWTEELDQLLKEITILNEKRTIAEENLKSAQQVVKQAQKQMKIEVNKIKREYRDRSKTNSKTKEVKRLV